MIKILVCLLFFAYLPTAKAQGVITYQDTMFVNDSTFSHIINYGSKYAADGTLRASNNEPTRGRVTWSGTMKTHHGNKKLITFTHRMKNSNDVLLVTHTLGSDSSESTAEPFEWPMPQQTWWTKSKGGEFAGTVSGLAAGDTIVVQNTIEWQ